MEEPKEKYNVEFKKEAVKYIQERSKSIPEIAEELNIPASTLSKWMSRGVNEEGGYNVAKMMMLQGSLPSAVFFANGEMAVGGMRAFAEGGFECRTRFR